MAQIGLPIREIQIEPLMIPVPQREQPMPSPHAPTPLPERVPVPA